MLNELRWWWREHTPSALWYKAKHFIQRGRRGWSDRDSWSMYNYLGPVLADMLQDLREKGHGYHCVHPDKIAEHTLGTSDECAEGWWEMLHRIEFGLRYYEYVHNGYCDEHYSFDGWRAKMYSAQVVIVMAFRDLGEYWGGMWD